MPIIFEFELEDDDEVIKDTELPLDRFGVRAQTVLQRLNINTIGDFLDVDWQNIDCWQLGAGTREQIRRIHDVMRKSPQDWLESNENCPDGADNIVQFECPADFADIQLPLDSFSVRARNIIQQNELFSICAFLNFDWNNNSVRQLGKTTRQEIIELRTAMGDTPESVRNWLATQHEQSRISKQSHYWPADSEMIKTAEGLLNWPYMWPSIVQKFLASQPRNYDILKRRYGLDGSPSYNLSDIGLNMGVSRERIRQIEAATLLQLRKILEGQVSRVTKTQLHPLLLQERENLKEFLEETGFPLADNELWNLLERRYGKTFSANEKAYFRLFLESWDFYAIIPSPPEVPQILGCLWLEGEDDRDFVLVTLRSIALNMREQVEPVSLFHLQIEVNRALKSAEVNRHCDDVAFRRLISLWPRAEEVAPDLYQTRFDFLPSHQSRAERILREWAANGKMSASIPEICREINHRHAILGKEGEVIVQAVTMACSSTPNIKNIGKSGQWALQENAGETRPLYEIIQEALLKLNRPATLEELNEYVTQRRECGTNTVACLMNQHLDFQRVGRGIYALRVWGLKDAPPQQRAGEYQHEFDDMLLEIFLENNVEPIPLAELANRLQARLGGNINTIRMRLERSRWIETTSISKYRLMAHWQDNPQIEDNSNEKPERITKTRRVHEAARAILEKAANYELTGATLTSLIEAQTGFVKPMIYSTLTGMPDIEKIGELRNLTYRLKRND